MPMHILEMPGGSYPQERKLAEGWTLEVKEIDKRAAAVGADIHRPRFLHFQGPAEHLRIWQRNQDSNSVALGAGAEIQHFLQAPGTANAAGPQTTL